MLRFDVFRKKAPWRCRWDLLLTLCTLKLATADLFRWSTLSEPTKPICGTIIDEWVYNLDALMARAPMATKYKDSDAIYYLATCKNVALCNDRVTNSMAAVCSPSGQTPLVTNQNLEWSLLDPKRPNAGISMMAKKGPKCFVTGSTTRTLRVDFECAPGKIPTNFTIIGTPAPGFCTTHLAVRVSIVLNLTLDLKENIKVFSSFRNQIDLLTFCNDNIQTKDACPTGGPFNPFSPTQSNGWVWATNIIVLTLGCVYVLGGCFYNIKYQEKSCGLNACPPHAKECPFYVKDGCQHFCSCLIPIFKKCLTRFCKFLIVTSNCIKSTWLTFFYTVFRLKR